MKDKIRIILFRMIFVCGIILLTACKKEEIPEERKHTELELWHYFDTPSMRDMMREYVDHFNQSQDEIEVRIRYIPEEDYRKQLALSIADEQAPDLVIVDSADFMSFNSMQSFADLTNTIPDLDQYIELGLKPCTQGGRVSGFPLGINCLAFYCNTDLLEEQNLTVPKTWEEFMRTAQILSKKSKDGSAGCVFPSLQSEESTFHFLPLLWSMGGSLNDVTSENSRKAFTFLQQLALTGAMDRRDSTMTQMDIIREFEKGKIAMIFSSTLAEQEMLTNNPEFHFSTTILPGEERSYSVTGGEILGALGTKHRPEALEFIKYMATKERISDFTQRSGFFPAREDVLMERYDASEEMQNKVEILRTATTRTVTSDWPEISYQLSLSLSQVLNGEDVDTATDELKKNIQAVIAE